MEESVEDRSPERNERGRRASTREALSDLHRRDGQARVLDRHHDAVVGERGRAQRAVGGESLAVERMVARDL